MFVDLEAGGHMKQKTERDLDALFDGALREYRDLDTPEFRDWLNRTIDSAPALTDRQCQRISALLWPDH